MSYSGSELLTQAQSPAEACIGGWPAIAEGQ